MSKIYELEKYYFLTNLLANKILRHKEPKQQNHKIIDRNQTFKIFHFQLSTNVSFICEKKELFLKFYCQNIIHF